MPGVGAVKGKGYASFHETIPADTGPGISLAMLKRFAIPGYRKVIDLPEKYQVPLNAPCSYTPVDFAQPPMALFAGRTKDART